MAVDPAIVERLRTMIFGRADGLRVTPSGSPLIEKNLALWEFLGMSRASLSELEETRSWLERALGDGVHERDRGWMTEYKEGCELFRESREVWIVQFGDPFRSEGVPPNRPGEGALYYLDPELNRMMVVHGDVEIPEGFRSAVDPAERDRLAAVEPGLRRLTVTAVESDGRFRIIDGEREWPALLVGDGVYDVKSVQAIPPEVLEAERGKREEVGGDSEEEAFDPDSGILRRLLDAGPVYRVSFERPPHPEYPGPTVWLAPEADRYEIDASVLHVSFLCEEDFRRVVPFGARDRSTYERFDRIEREAATSLDRAHAENLVREEPRLRSLLQELEGGGRVCRRCGEKIRGGRVVQRDREHIWVNCMGCMMGDLNGIPRRCWYCGGPGFPPTDAGKALDPLKDFETYFPRNKFDPDRSGCPGCGA